MNNGVGYLAAFYGVLQAGGVVVPIPPDVEARRRDAILASAGCRVLLTTPRAAAQWSGDLEAVLNRAPDSADAAPTPAGLAAIFFTAGSSGEPKGVMLSHENLLANARGISQYLDIRATDRALAVLPFYHAFGNSVLQSHLLNGATLVLAGSLTFPETIVDAIKSQAITSFSGVPDAFQLLLQRTTLGQDPLPSLRYCAVAGGKLRTDLAAEVARRIQPARFFVMYGQTEATARLSYLPPDRLEDKAGSIGRGMEGVELQVVDAIGRPVAVGDVGEIRARGPGIMLGYWRNPAATEDVLRDGWLYTGDLATVDEEGFVFPQGRANSIVKIAGFRVHPAEVEDFVTESFPEFQAVVVPFELPLAGTRLALFLSAARAGGDRDLTAIQDACRRQLPKYKLPAWVEYLDEWPLNHALKVNRLALRARAEEATASGVN